MSKNHHSDSSFARLLENYFLKYLMSQKSASPRTVASYRDGFTLYLRYLTDKQDIAPEKVEIKHFALDYVSDFAEYLEKERSCGASTINLRLATIRSFLHYALVEVPEYTDTLKKTLSLPSRKTDQPVITFINKNEYEALLGVCNEEKLISSRDKLIIMIMYNTGCRVSELINIHVSDIASVSGARETPYIHFFGKGRKERTTPIWKSTNTYIQRYVKQYGLSNDSFLFQSRRGECITRSGVAQRITVIAKKASVECSSLKEKNITPHTFRHSAAMNLLQAGVDISTIAIWLGHESIETTHKYMVADLEVKRRAMEKLDETSDGSFHYKPSKSILAFLNSL